MNKKLPYDVSRCNNDTCPMKDNCARFINFREGNMNPHYGSPVSNFQPYWEHGSPHCRSIIEDV